MLIFFRIIQYLYTILHRVENMIEFDAVLTIDEHNDVEHNDGNTVRKCKG